MPGLLLALAMCLVMEPAPTEEADANDPYALMAKGFAANEAGDDAAAAKAMAAAYVRLSAAERVQDPGRQAVSIAVDALEREYARTGDLEPLRTERTLLRTYVGDIDDRAASDAPEDPEALELERKLRVRLQVLEAREDLDAAQPPVADDQPEDPPPPALFEAQRPQPTPERDRSSGTLPPRGPVMIGVGASLVVGGAVLLGQGLRFPSLIRAAREDAQQEVDASNGALMPADDWDDYEDRLRTRGRTLVGVGAGALVAGAALVTVGAIVLRKDRERTSVSAMVSPSAASITLQGRF